MFITLNYHILATFHTIFKINFRNFAKNFVKKILTLSQFLIHSKLKVIFHIKTPIPDDLKSFLVNKFTCASCSSSYIDKTCCHFKTRIEQHIKKDNKSHIFKHLHSTTTCFDSCNSLSFKIIDKANSKFDIKIKEALHISWTKSNLNAQQNHLVLTLSLQFLSLLFFSSVFVFFSVFLFHLLFSLSLS